MFRHFVLLYENNATSIPGLRGCPFIFSGIYAVLYFDVIFHISQNVFQIWSTLAGYEE